MQETCALVCVLESNKQVPSVQNFLPGVRELQDGKANMDSDFKIVLICMTACHHAHKYIYAL